MDARNEITNRVAGILIRSMLKNLVHLDLTRYDEEPYDEGIVGIISQHLRNKSRV